MKLENPIETPHGETIYELIGNSPNGGNCTHSVAYAEIAPGRSSIRHYHPETEESYTVVSGEGILELGESRITMTPGSSRLIPPGTTHKISNTGKETLGMWVVCVPPWSPDCSIFLEQWDESRQSLIPAEPYSSP